MSDLSSGLTPMETDSLPFFLIASTSSFYSMPFTWWKCKPAPSETFDQQRLSYDEVLNFSFRETLT
jgi:hypothetical protein